MENPLFLTTRDIEIILKAINSMKRIPYDAWNLIDKLKQHLEEEGEI